VRSLRPRPELLRRPEGVQSLGQQLHPAVAVDADGIRASGSRRAHSSPASRITCRVGGLDRYVIDSSTSTHASSHTANWPAGSSYPDYFMIGIPHMNFYEGTASIKDVRLYIPR